MHFIVQLPPQFIIYRQILSSDFVHAAILTQLGPFVFSRLVILDVPGAILTPLSINFATAKYHHLNYFIFNISISKNKSFYKLIFIFYVLYRTYLIHGYFVLLNPQITNTTQNTLVKNLFFIAFSKITSQWLCEFEVSSPKSLKLSSVVS